MVKRRVGWQQRIGEGKKSMAKRFVVPVETELFLLEFRMCQIQS